MVWFVIAIILLLIGVGAVAVALAGGGAGAGLGFIPIVVAGLLMIPACLYSQDAGEVVVLKNMGGSIAGYSADAGFHGKLPWQSTMQYDTRNNVISYVAKGEEDYDGGSARGRRSPSTTRTAHRPTLTSRSTIRSTRSTRWTCTRTTASRPHS